MLLKTKLIGISGCTNGGKTTLSKKLMLQFPNSFYLSQDDFYFERPDPNNNLAVPDFNNLTTTDQVNNSNSQPEEHYKYIPELESYNFDVIDCIDMKKFHRELNKLIKLNTYDFIFMDGILLYEDVQLCSMLHKSYFIDLDMVTCKKRRAQRNYIIPDTGAYFEKCCWREFQNYKARCDAKYTHLIYIDGTDAPENIFNFVMADLDDLITLLSPGSKMMNSAASVNTAANVASLHLPTVITLEN